MVGGSGAGKSTLVTALCGFKPATEGAVFLNGVDLYQNFDAYRNEMGYVPQDDIIHEELTVYKALDYAARLRMPGRYQPPRARAAHPRGHRRAGSQGLRRAHHQTAERRPAQARVHRRGTAHPAQPVLPGRGHVRPGPGHREAAMMKLLRKLADQGRTIILITHATKNVMACDKVVFLARGGLLAYFGPPEDALEVLWSQGFRRDLRAPGVRRHAARVGAAIPCLPRASGVRGAPTQRGGLPHGRETRTPPPTAATAARRPSRRRTRLPSAEGTAARTLPAVRRVQARRPGASRPGASSSSCRAAT